MASGHVNRAQRPNTWLHRPMLHSCRKSLPTRSRPHMGHRAADICWQKGRPNKGFGALALRRRGPFFDWQCFGNLYPAS